MCPTAMTIADPPKQPAAASQSDFEREKWLADLELRRRELVLKEREQDNRDRDLQIKEREQRASAWRNPLAVAIFAAAAAATGNAVVAFVNGTLARGVEDSKAESTRILEMIKTGDPEVAASNLDFLLQAGLIQDDRVAGRVKDFLARRKPGTGPALPSPGNIGFEPSQYLTEPLQRQLQDTLNRYSQRMTAIGFVHSGQPVTVAIEALGGLPNAWYDPSTNRIVIDRRIADDTSVALREYSHHLLLPDPSKALEVEGWAHALEGGLADYFTCSFLNNPNVGEVAAKAFDPSSRYIRTLANNRTFTDVNTDQPDFIYVGGEMLGGFFWDLRKELGAEVVDRFLASTWRVFSPAPQARIVPSFLAAMLDVARARDARLAQAISQAGRARNLPLPR